MKKLVFFIITLFAFNSMLAQTSDVTIGCVPLEVNFTSPDLSSYYWTFGDGNNSNLEDPSYNYTDAGVYTVELFEGVGGTKIGEIEITVLSPPEIMIGANEQAGCSPFQVQFTNESIIDPNAQISGYFWSFGDGGNSTAENPNYTYINEGVYEVSLRIESTLIGCTTTKEFTDFITVSGNINAGFSVDNTVICDAPATFNITNNTQDASGYTYMWDFGNGQTFDGYNPPAANYTNEGTYTITMIVDSGDGCVVTLTREVTVGKPKIEINFPDTVCINEIVIAGNTTDASGFAWSFGSNANPQNSASRFPSVVFNQGGPQIVTFSALASSTCTTDTFFTVFVEDPKAAFTVDPVILCSDPAVYTFSHPMSDLANYTWYIKELDTTFVGGPDYTFTYDEPFRDSFYISRLDTFNIYLDIITKHGCKANDSLEFYHRAPEAHFIPDITRGCAPLTVNFDEVSLSTENITSWDWVFGDGTTANVSSPNDMTHTYDNPGEYYVQLAIENEAGCKDTSAGVYIYVGEPLTSDFTFDQTEICLYDTVNFEALNLDPRIDAWHFDTDDSRISDCYEDPTASHVFVHAPGTYPVSLTLEYNGCFNTIDNGETITVNGSKSRIKFMTNCIDPYTVMFQDSSLNAMTSIWYINGDTINMDTIMGDVFNYTFDSTGDYTIKLWTDDDTMCDPDSSTVNVYIRDIEAKFDLPDEICAYTPIQLNASASTDVDNTCSKGYEWFGIARRPRMLDVPTADAAWLPGPFSVRLIVEDVNGCKDTLDKNSEAFEIQANFEADKERICFPGAISFTDLSMADTSIVAWEWSFDDAQQNPMNVNFTKDDAENDFLPIQLIVTDALGCMDTTQIGIPTYDITSIVEFDPSITCIGNTVNFTATDYTQGGSFLDFNWSFGPNGSLGSSTDQNPSFEVTQAGNIPVRLFIVEDSTGCSNQYDFTVIGITPPDAEFTIDVDDPTMICPDEIVVFLNESIEDGPVTYLWDFGNDNSSFQENPSTFFDVGTFDITLTVNSVYGCSDSYMQQLTLEGPQADFTIDKDVLCLGDTVTFSLINANNISFYEWGFGDGEVLENVETVAHPYTFLPDTLAGNIKVSLIIESENGCRRSVDKSIQLSDLMAGFEIETDTMNICNREIQFNDTSEGADSYFWDFGNGQTSTEQNPLIMYTESDTFTITQTVEVNGGICESKISEDLIITALEKVTVPTVISPNGDDLNDNFDVIIREDQRECIEVIRSKIFNRWGNMIYDNELPPEGWNGRYENGDLAPAEIYT